ncbi:ORF MSV062 SCG gene family protein [Melanoplus sanguinipes entomopoxvirus]|uniref:ORF MSV062 SCG gene family protein n=1 Tax=Melanoplus sanguinipes entomopoxvirus TaxID=83191 RepID=Q9YW30_MSEPV|nr:ORF MSV062 SCG gene family protein [Melanoplus sanguinipes entomopoxvirus]AAC97817.1 ORF MSV062 SCG gene family protein [Melanoplus sanguinipes entomopoxvirus 'O']
MNGVYFVVIVLIIIIIILFIFYYVNLSVSKFTNDNFDNTSIVDFMVINASMYQEVLDNNFFSAFNNLKIIPTFVFLSNYVEKVIVNDWYNISSNTLPINNFSNKLIYWIFGGWYVAISGRNNWICVRANDSNIKCLNDEEILLKFLISDYDTGYTNNIPVRNSIIISNIMFKMEEIIIINISYIALNFVDKDYYTILCKIFNIFKTNYINDKKFIISGQLGINSKFIQSALETIFDIKEIVSSCYDGAISYVDNNQKVVQSSFIVLDKRLCPYGVRFGIRLLENAMPSYKLVLYATIYNKNRKNKYNNMYNDKLSLNIFENIKSLGYDLSNINWSEIDISELDNNYENANVNLIDDDATMEVIKLSDIIEKINNTTTNGNNATTNGNNATTNGNNATTNGN